jgi:hypothetical protein
MEQQTVLFVTRTVNYLKCNFIIIAYILFRESGDFATLFFLVRQHWSGCRYHHFLPTLKRFSCNGAVDWSTMYLSVKVFYNNGDSFVIA